MSQKYVVVSFLEPQRVDYNFSAKEWPPHITLLPLFIIGKSVEELKTKLKGLASGIEPFEVTTEGQTLFGVNKDVPVVLLRLDNKITELHDKLVKMSHDVVTTYDTPEFVNKSYKPHITIQEYHIPSTGQTYQIKNVSLIDMYPNNDINRREIIATYLLG